ncbi:ABC transporter ATP-binding protein [Desulfatibacillum aliphaticivorans]|uniref:ABC transporter ATP-binding protein n=1 Tax=Desulfatibacillum aliphaticivorans TaxID=218208 RepID=UPI0003F94620|nr:ABC transporter ATP-binding protein [Desulfatibacillum aliphaticivorans]
MEEGKLGKAYDLNLLKRLWPYGKPYLRIIFIALIVSVGITIFTLATPYVSKMAIDRYIIASWYKVQAGDVEQQAIVKKYAAFFQPGARDEERFISHTNTRKLDPMDLNVLETGGVLAETYYKIPPTAKTLPILEKLESSSIKAKDGDWFTPTILVNSLPAGEMAALRARDLTGVMNLGLLLLVLAAGAFYLGYLEYNLLEKAGQNIMADMRLALFTHIQSQSLSFFDKHPVGRLVTRATNDIENLNEMFKSVLVTVFKDMFLLLGIIVVMAYMDWRLALVCYALIPVVVICAFVFSALARDAFRQLRATVSAINSFCQERFAAMAAIQLYAVEAHQMARFEKINEQNYLAGMRQVRVFGVFLPVMEFLSHLGLAIIIWYGGSRVLGEQATLGTVVAFISYLRTFFRPLRDIAEKYNIMQAAMASSERIFEFMDEDQTLDLAENPIAVKDVKGDAAFDDVSFCYEADKPILQDINFSAKPGEMIALVGRTGSGKTTLMHLLFRFYDPATGRIRLENKDLRDWDLKALRSHMALIQQDVFLFAGSIRDNITLGDPEITEEKIASALEQAEAGFVYNLEKGLDHHIAERGINLSAGECQLLSFARALAYNTEILILDEATSSVDPQTERAIQKAILKIAGKRTTLVVAHRLSTVERADNILVVRQGRIVETGTHQQLMEKQGHYYKLRQVLSN